MIVATIDPRIAHARRASPIERERLKRELEHRTRRRGTLTLRPAKSEHFGG